jgi:hypothetical protein
VTPPIQLQQGLNDFPTGIRQGHLFSAETMKLIIKDWVSRWGDLHTPLHALGYALDPEFIDHPDLFGNQEVSRGIVSSLRKLAPNDHARYVWLYVIACVTSSVV